MNEFVPFPFQESTAQTLLSGRSVILQAPTGAGKTAAALLPFIHALRDPSRQLFPAKCIYSVPMRVLADQFVSACRDQVRRSGWQDRLAVAIQTGEHPDDRQFEADLTFATIDQTLSSFILMPCSQPRKKANLNAGAIASAYLVFDEFHLFEAASTLPTTLEMLRMLKGVAPFLLMTATFSSHMLQRLGCFLEARVIPDPNNQVERQQMLDLPAEKGKSRFYHWSDEPLTASAVLEKHRGHARSLVVCNVVDRAQELYRHLATQQARGDPQVILLHSHFLPDDRANKERALMRDFGKDGDRTSRSVIAVATQVVEVGLDMSAEVLHTELAPANALLQRAGRCARYAGETGHVYVYEVPNYAPYATDSAGDELDRQVIDRTRAWLQQHDPAERVGFIQEQAWVDAAHTAADEEMLTGLMAVRSQHRRRLEAALTGNREEAGEIIRRVVSQPMTISARPEQWLEHPFDAPLFSLHPGTLKKHARQWLEAQGAAPDAGRQVAKLVEVAEDEQDNSVRYAWQPIQKAAELTGVPLVVVSPGLASYNKEEGLILTQGGPFWDEAALLRERSGSHEGMGIITYKVESYQRHIELAYRQFRYHVWPGLEQAALRLEQRAGWPPGSLEKAAALAVLFHDVGKLTAGCGGKPGWQTWASAWQKRVGGASMEAYAHTDYDGSAAHQQLDRQLGHGRPAHALEGAVAVVPLLAQLFRQQPGLFKAAFSAIGRHHGAFTATYNAYQLVAQAARIIGETLTQAGISAAQLNLAVLHARDETPAYRAEESASRCFVSPSDDDELVAYMLLVRAVRLADQAATAEGAK